MEYLYHLPLVDASEISIIVFAHHVLESLMFRGFKNATHNTMRKLTMLAMKATPIDPGEVKQES